MSLSRLTTGTLAAEGATSSTLTLTWPTSGITTGSIAIIVVSLYETDSAGAAANTPTGFTLQSTSGGDVFAGSGNQESKAFVYTKECAGTESGNITISNNNTNNLYWCATLDVYNGSSDLTFASISAVGTGNGTDAIAPSVSGTSGQGLICAFALSDPPGTTNSGPSGMTQGSSQTGTTNSARNYYVDLSSTGATGTKTWDFTSTRNYAAYSILVNGAASAVALDQEGFQFGADDGSESAHTFYGAQDSNVTRQTGENVLLRALIDSTGDTASAAYTLRYQKNGSGGYVAVPVGSGSVTSPPQVTSATVASVTTAADPWSLTNGRPAAASGDLVVVVIGWDDSTTVTSVTPPAGANSETAVSIAGPVASASTEMRLQAWYYITTGSWTNATWSWDPSASETCRQAAFVIPAGQFNASDPIGWASTRASAGTAESSVNSPTGTAESDDGDGRLFIAFGSDADAITAPASGTTTVNNGTTGGVGLCIVSRNTVVSNSESIAAITATIASDSWATVAFVVKPATTTNELYVATSGNITAGGEATTARLTAPSGKTTGDFVTGRRWDNENGTDSIDITTDDYTEVEWCLRAQSPATNGDYYDFRVYAGASALDTYGVTPRWTIGTPSTPSSIPRGYRAPAFRLAALMGF